MSGEDAALVRAAWVPGRAEPDRRSEMVTQWVSGETLWLEEEGPERWLRVRDPGGYRAWVDGGGLVRVEAAEAADWAERATAWSTGTDLAPAPGERAGPPPPRWLPWGGRAAPEGDGRVEVAGGARVMPVEPAAVVTDRADRFPRTGEGVVRTARRWLGVPYLWGGRTREGVDCSGLVQAVFAAHGIDLPRDSGDQREAVAGKGADLRGPDGSDPGRDAGAATRDGGRHGDRHGGRHGDRHGGRDDDGDGEGRGEDPASGESPPLEGPPGELLFFGPEEGGTDHAAIRVGGTRVLHAASGNGQVGEDDLAGDDPMARRLRGRLRAAGRPLEEGDEEGRG